MTEEANLPETSRTWSWKAFGLGVLGTTISIGVLIPWPKPPVNPPECPHDPIWGSTQEAAEIHEFTGGQDDVPEFQDCQKFLVGSPSNPKYDSLFAIFVSHRLSFLFMEAPLLPRGGGGGGVAPNGGLPGETTSTSTAIVEPVGVIRAWGDYQQLGIKRGINCLLVKRELDVWSASMVPTESIARCTASSTSTPYPDPTVQGLNFGSGKQLDVEHVAAASDVVPPVGRWGFDRDGWQQYVVIKCGAGTCFIGSEDGFVREDHVSALDAIGMQVSNKPEYDDPVYTVAGWHDVQLLAQRPRGGVISWLKWRLFRWFEYTPPQIKPAQPLIWGSVIPDTDLGHATLAEFESGWVPIAKVALSEQSDDYAAKANFSATKKGVFNLVEACLDKGDNCPDLPSDMGCPETEAGSGEAWVSQHTNAADGSKRHYCVKLNPLGDDVAQVVPGTVRWRWLAEDETLWFRCPEGCCTPE